ncbi:lactoylglutathione lyase, partial [Enterococcus lactis]|nr:lactoylglutathione lyase [Enterococcus lactis]
MKIAFNQVPVGDEESRTRVFPKKKWTLEYWTLPGPDNKLKLTYIYDPGSDALGNGYFNNAIG